MKISQMWNKIPNGLQRLILGIGIVGALGVVGKTYLYRYGDLWSQSIQMVDLIENSPRKEYVVKKGDTLDSLRKVFLSISKDEFPALDDKAIFWNQDNFYREKFGGYKNLVATNIWARNIEGLTAFEPGDTILIPYRQKSIN